MYFCIYAIDRPTDQPTKTNILSTGRKGQRKIQTEILQIEFKINIFFEKYIIREMLQYLLFYFCLFSFIYILKTLNKIIIQRKVLYRSYELRRQTKTITCCVVIF